MTGILTHAILSAQKVACYETRGDRPDAEIPARHIVGWMILKYGLEGVEKAARDTFTADVLAKAAAKAARYSGFAASEKIATSYAREMARVQKEGRADK